MQSYALIVQLKSKPSAGLIKQLRTLGPMTLKQAIEIADELLLGEQILVAGVSQDFAEQLSRDLTNEGAKCRISQSEATSMMLYCPGLKSRAAWNKLNILS